MMDVSSQPGSPRAFDREELDAFFCLAPLPKTTVQAILDDLNRFGTESSVHAYMQERAQRYRGALMLPDEVGQADDGETETALE